MEHVKHIYGAPMSPTLSAGLVVDVDAIRLLNGLDFPLNRR